MWAESDGDGSGAEAPCGVWGRGAEGRSAVKVPEATVGKSPHGGLEWRRIPMWSCAGGKQPGGSQGFPLARRDAGTCHLPTRGLLPQCPPRVTPITQEA